MIESAADEPECALLTSVKSSEASSRDEPTSQSLEWEEEFCPTSSGGRRRLSIGLPLEDQPCHAMRDNNENTELTDEGQDDSLNSNGE